MTFPLFFKCVFNSDLEAKYTKLKNVQVCGVSKELLKSKCLISDVRNKLAPCSSEKITNILIEMDSKLSSSDKIDFHLADKSFYLTFGNIVRLIELS